jgi:hypothetical protein
MSKTYFQKDLGYPRASTGARYCLEMSDGTKWDLPVQIIADNRDEHYADEKEDTIKFIREGSLDQGEIADWAQNNMNWSDVKPYARMVGAASGLDYAEDWSNADYTITGSL